MKPNGGVMSNASLAVTTGVRRAEDILVAAALAKRYGRTKALVDASVTFVGARLPALWEKTVAAKARW